MLAYHIRLSRGSLPAIRIMAGQLDRIAEVMMTERFSEMDSFDRKILDVMAKFANALRIQRELDSRKVKLVMMNNLVQCLSLL